MRRGLLPVRRPDLTLSAERNLLAIGGWPCCCGGCVRCPTVPRSRRRPRGRCCDPEARYVRLELGVAAARIVLERSAIADGAACRADGAISEMRAASPAALNGTMLARLRALVSLWQPAIERVLKCEPPFVS